MSLDPPTVHEEPVEAEAAPRPLWRQLANELFQQDGLAAVFTHARNVITGTVIVAAGLHAIQHPLPSQAPATWTLHLAGWLVSAVGVLLLVLNLCDGLHSLARRRHPTLLRIATIWLYVGLSVRLVQVFMLFRLAI
jgi:hypothetical protein